MIFTYTEEEKAFLELSLRVNAEVKASKWTVQTFIEGKKVSDNIHCDTADEAMEVIYCLKHNHYLGYYNVRWICLIRQYDNQQIVFEMKYWDDDKIRYDDKEKKEEECGDCENKNNCDEYNCSYWFEHFG